MSGTQHQLTVCDFHHCLRFLVSIRLQHRSLEPTVQSTYNAFCYFNTDSWFCSECLHWSRTRTELRPTGHWR